MPIKRVIEPTRTSEQIERDLAMTRARIDATLDAMQDRLKPANLARDAVKSLAASARRTATTAVKRLTPRSTALVDHDQNAIILDADEKSIVKRPRRKPLSNARKKALAIGAAVGAAGIAGAVAARAISKSRKSSKAATAKKSKRVQSQAAKITPRTASKRAKRKTSKSSRSN